MLFSMALVASGLQAFVSSSVTGMRTSVDRKLLSRKSSANTICLHFSFELVGLRPLPVLVPAVQIARTLRSREDRDRLHGDGSLLEWQRAQRSAKTILASQSASSIRWSDSLSPPGASFSLCGAVAFRKNSAMFGRLCFGRFPIGGIFPRVVDLDRRDRLSADQRLEMQQPFFAEQADIEEDAIERAQGTTESDPSFST